MRGRPDDLGIALRGLGGALLGAALGVLTFFSAAAPLAVIGFLIGPGLGWGFAVGGPALMWRSAFATAASCLGAAVAAAGLGFAALSLMPPLPSHLGPFRWDLALLFGIVGLLPGALAGQMWARMLGWRQGLRKSAIAAGICGFAVPVILAMVLWPSEAEQNRHSSDWFGDLSVLGLILKLLILSPPAAFAVSSAFLSPAFLSTYPEDG